MATRIIECPAKLLQKQLSIPLGASCDEIEEVLFVPNCLGLPDLLMIVRTCYKEDQEHLENIQKEAPHLCAIFAAESFGQQKHSILESLFMPESQWYHTHVRPQLI